jgi:hypothetical protein
LIFLLLNAVLTFSFPVEVNIVYKSLERPAEAIAAGKTAVVVGTTWKEIVLDQTKTVFVNFFAPCMVWMVLVSFH